jgi:hypothetical protein
MLEPTKYKIGILNQYIALPPLHEFIHKNKDGAKISNKFIINDFKQKTSTYKISPFTLAVIENKYNSAYEILLIYGDIINNDSYGIALMTEIIHTILYLYIYVDSSINMINFTNLEILICKLFDINKIMKQYISINEIIDRLLHTRHAFDLDYPRVYLHKNGAYIVKILSVFTQKDFNFTYNDITDICNIIHINVEILDFILQNVANKIKIINADHELTNYILSFDAKLILIKNNIIKNEYVDNLKKENNDLKIDAAKMNAEIKILREIISNLTMAPPDAASAGYIAAANNFSKNKFEKF